MVYISSHNIVSSLGFTSSENFKNFEKNISGIKEINNPEISPTPAFVSIVKDDELNKNTSQLINNEQHTKFEKLLILSINDALLKSEVNISDKKTAIIISTTKGNINLLNKNNSSNFKEDRVQIWKSSEIIKNHFNNPNEVITISNACISGALAIIVAKRLIDAKKYDNVIVAGADILPEFTLSGFQAFKAVSEEACKPFDKNRTGMTPGEGAGTIILTNDVNKAPKPTIIISGGASSNDANHISGPSRTGEELAIAINKSLKEANIKPSEVEYVSAHGTATLYNDEMEAKALALTKLNNANISSIKGYIGHTFGAAGIIETIFGINAIAENKLYKSLGYNEQGTENKLNIITKNLNSNINNVVKTASGFGSCNASLVISKFNYEKKYNSETQNFSVTKKVKISNNKVFINDIEIIIPDNNKDLEFPKFAKLLYKYLKIKYPKYYKMDKLSKLAFIASEFLLKDTNLLQNFNNEDIALTISNGSSSLITDAGYQKTISDKENYFPSPSVFVYTLANVMLGEICIKNKFKGENTVFISKEFNKDFIFDYAKILFNTEKAKVCITGRIDYNYPNENYDAELYLLVVNK